MSIYNCIIETKKHEEESEKQESENTELKSEIVRLKTQITEQEQTIAAAPIVVPASDDDEVMTPRDQTKAPKEVVIGIYSVYTAYYISVT